MAGKSVPFNIQADADGANELVAGVEGKCILVTRLAIFKTADADGYFSDGTNELLGGTTVKIPFSTMAGFILPPFEAVEGHKLSRSGWMKTAAGLPLQIVLDAGGEVVGCGAYELVDP